MGNAGVDFIWAGSVIEAYKKLFSHGIRVLIPAGAGFIRVGAVGIRIREIPGVFHEFLGGRKNRLLWVQL